MTIKRCFILICSLGFSLASFGAETTLSVPMDYRLIRQVLVSQLFTGNGQSARVWKDAKQCNYVDLANPQLAGADGQVKISNHVHARFGAQLGNNCMKLVEWNGILETLQAPTLDASGNVLSFPVTHIDAFDNQGRKLDIAQLQDLLQQAVAPRLAALKIDLASARGDIVKGLLPFVPDENSEQLYDTVNSLRFRKVQANAGNIVLDVAFSANRPPAGNLVSAPFNPEEMQQWRRVWQKWQGSLGQAITNAKLSGGEAQRAGLQTMLQKAGVTLEQALLATPEAADPLRRFLNDSWSDLTPLLRTVANHIPGAEGLRFLTLLAPTDVMHELETVTTPLGLDLSANGLRKIARSYLQQIEQG
ncbi:MULTISPECIES: hypothetical protein [Methylomonas]|uniref:hypothetical protein n=1 Tax=Methylomonas TaxID=416 RepID=UPI0012329203|nr:hypothetical protein [Methylomonas rhizoryzae]